MRCSTTVSQRSRLDGQGTQSPGSHNSVQAPHAAPPNSGIARAQVRRDHSRHPQAEEGDRNNVTFWGACRLAEMVAEGVLTGTEP